MRRRPLSMQRSESSCMKITDHRSIAEPTRPAVRSNEPKEKRNARTHGKRRAGADLVCRLLLEKKKERIKLFSGRTSRGDQAAWNNRADARYREPKTQF